MKYFYIIANLSKEYVKDAQVFIKTYLEAKGAVCRLNSASLRDRESTCLLYTSQDGSARKTKIVSGIYDSGRMEVISGLDSSSLVITSWSNELLDGAQVILDTREAGE